MLCTTYKQNIQAGKKNNDKSQMLQPPNLVKPIQCAHFTSEEHFSNPLDQTMSRSQKWQATSTQPHVMLCNAPGREASNTVIERPRTLQNVIE
jgi:hypothetical protein